MALLFFYCFTGCEAAGNINFDIHNVKLSWQEGDFRELWSSQNVIISLNIHVYDLKISSKFIKAFVTTLTGIIQNFKFMPLFLTYFFNFRLISLIIHVNNPRLIQNFLNWFLIPPAVYIPNLNFILPFLLWFLNFRLISLIIHENDVIVSHIPKKSACVTDFTILWTH